MPSEYLKSFYKASYLIACLIFIPLSAFAEDPLIYKHNIPAYGFPFVNTRESMPGSLIIDRFVGKKSSLIVIAKINYGGQVKPATLPVNIAVSTCDYLHMKIGPQQTAGLTKPLNLTQKVGSGKMTRGQLCAAADAVKTKNWAQFAEIMNHKPDLTVSLSGITGQTASPQGIAGSSCSLSEYFTCIGIEAACAAECLAGPECAACFVSLNAAVCTCLFGY